MFSRRHHTLTELGEIGRQPTISNGLRAARGGAHRLEGGAISSQTNALSNGPSGFPLTCSTGFRPKENQRKLIACPSAVIYLL